MNVPFIPTTAGLFDFGNSSWPGGQFSPLLTMWEKFSLFLTVSSNFFLPSPYVRKLFSISHSFSLREKNFLTWIGSYVQTLRTCFLPSPYVRKFFLPSPYVRKFFSVSHSSLYMCKKFSLLLPMWENSSHLLPYKRKNFSSSHLRWEKFSHVGEVWPAWAYSVMPAWPSNSHKWSFGLCMIHHRRNQWSFIQSEKVYQRFLVYRTSNSIIQCGTRNWDVWQLLLYYCTGKIWENGFFIVFR